MFRARPLGILALGAVCAVALPAVTAPAQQSMMFMDDGEGPGFMRFGGPQVHTLRKPDFERSDVPIFRDSLRLSEDQQAVVEELLTAYIEAYQALVAEHFPRQAGPPGVAMHGGDGENAFALEGMIGLPDPGELEDLGIDVEEGGVIAVAVSSNMTMDPEMMPEGGTMDIDIEAGGDSDTGAPSAGVMISVAGPDGEELPEEVRKQLEAKAAELAAKLQEQMEKNIEEGRDPLDGAFPVADRIEEHRRRFEELEKRAEALKAAGAGLRQEFIDDVQERLADEQLARWPILDRALTRKKTLPNGRLDGERVDLIATLDTMELNDAARTAIREEADAYALVLHDALIQRNAFLDRADKRVNTALESGDTTKALSIVDHGTRLRVAVRDANHWFGEAIAERLPEPDAGAFRAEVNQLAHPRVFRPTRGQKAFDATRRMSDELDPATRQAIDELESAYHEELALANERLVATIRKNQPGETRHAIEMMASAKAGEPMMIGHDENDPIRQAYGKRREMDARYVKLLRGMLTSEQAERLPKPPKRRNTPFIIERGF
ncbi:MAG: hypothetical protein GY715_09160 [Planctomycetes bacterium]|nr:hypothetical protein [Planctomycetota bacterium]